MSRHRVLTSIVILALFLVPIGAWLAQALIPYALVRMGIYSTAAFLFLFGASALASHWIDLRTFAFKPRGTLEELTRRLVLALSLAVVAVGLVWAWQFQENRVLTLARDAYANKEYGLARELFFQQLDRHWSASAEYNSIWRAIAACDNRLLFEEHRIQAVSYETGSPEYDRHARVMEEMESKLDYPY